MKVAVPLALVAILTTVACSGASSAREGDDTREGALELGPRGLVADAIDAEADNLDYVRFEMAMPAPVAIRIDWHRPAIKARLRVLDGRGKRLHQADHAAGAPVDVLRLDLPGGPNYLEIRASKGASPYSVAVIPTADLGADAIPRPE
jgi:hypothetical protein